jgi:hypothetical protein
MITSEAMLDPAVSLGILRLDTQLALAGSDERKVVSVRESFNARIAGMALQSWFVALGRNLLAAATENDAAMKEVAVEQLRRLTKQLADSAELRQMLADAMRNAVARHGMTSAEYQQVFNDLKGQGYRLIDVSGYEVSGQDRYAAIWEPRPGPPWEARHGLTSAQYQQRCDDLKGQGYQLVHVSGYGVQGQDLYAAIWEKRSGPPWQARNGMTSAEYQQVFNDLNGQGYRLINVSGYNIGGQDRYAAIWSE